MIVIYSKSAEIFARTANSRVCIRCTPSVDILRLEFAIFAAAKYPNNLSDDTNVFFPELCCFFNNILASTKSRCGPVRQQRNPNEIRDATKELVLHVTVNATQDRPYLLISNIYKRNYQPSILKRLTSAEFINEIHEDSPSVHYLPVVQSQAHQKWRKFGLSGLASDQMCQHSSHAKRPS